MPLSRKGIFQRMTAVDRQMCGIDPVPSKTLTPELLGRFYGLPLDKKERCLKNLGDHIREIQGKAPKSAEALQTVYDDWYKTVQQELADREMK